MRFHGHLFISTHSIPFKKAKHLKAGGRGSHSRECGRGENRSDMIQNSQN